MAQGVIEGHNYIDIDKEEERLPKECVKHKILDIIGDLALLRGLYILGEVTAVNSGHKLHHELMKGILNDSSNSSSRGV